MSEPPKSQSNPLEKPPRFSLKRVGVVTGRVLRQIRRDKRTFGMMIVMPAIVILIFGFALSGEIQHVPIAIENADPGYTGQRAPGVNITIMLGGNLTTNLKGDDRVTVTDSTFNTTKAAVDSGQYYAAIFIPSNFSYIAFQRANGSSINLTLLMYIDATKPTIRAAILGALQSALQDAMGTHAQGIDIQQELAFGGAEYSGLDVSIPSVMGFVLTFLVLLISLLTITRETTGGTLQRLFTTPLTAIERLLGYVFALLLIGMMMAAVVLAIGVFGFGAVVKGNFFILLTAVILYSLTHVLMAVFLSNFARNELQAVQMAPLIALPSMALSGMLVPVFSFPDYLQPIARIIPLYYGNNILEGIMLKGYGFAELAPDFLIICGIALLFLILAIVTVKNRIES